jgi:hypothetical protein
MTTNPTTPPPVFTYSDRETMALAVLRIACTEAVGLIRDGMPQSAEHCLASALVHAGRILGPEA